MLKINSTKVSKSFSKPTCPTPLDTKVNATVKGNSN